MFQKILIANRGEIACRQLGAATIAVHSDAGECRLHVEDPMIAKLISHGSGCETTIAIMRRALQALEIEGIHHNEALEARAAQAAS
ncbi:biotin carboxylase N-terminal domain-containing protein [Variovorax sp. UC74_104]|uniref:biotin carboxylase N-terminal domain-containing protein n=1 Tax=Variovorax sp. UC74_104 TaxID=3374555 RepID=UPI003757240C